LNLPDDVRAGVERALAERDLGSRVESARSVGGGCINNGARLDTDAGISVFLKWNPGAPDGMFAAEAEGLAALGAAQALRVPRPIAWAEEGSTPWLLLEYIAPGSTGPRSQEALGRGLARLHLSLDTPGFGWERDNWIGSLDQANEPTDSWPDFWRDRRMGPQLDMARGRGRARDRAFDDLMAVIPQALEDIETPELLHGDLWGGNWFVDEDGAPVIIDPAVYRGHGEVDLAMSELFGGFGPHFYDAYSESHGITDAYDAYRRDLYQLYYLLVHVNLFGGAYESGSLRAAERVLSELR